MDFQNINIAELSMDPNVQLDILDDVSKHSGHVPLFKDKLQENGLEGLKPKSLDIFQVNVGKLCNQECKHCHVDAGPKRTEVMTRETMEQCLEVIKAHNFSTVDITGGAPEMNPHFRWFVGECSKLDKKIIVRCNLTIIFNGKKYRDLPEFYKEHNIEVVSSLPFYNADRTDKMRGRGVFKSSIMALQKLNEVGYGKEGSGLILDLVYNPAGAFLPAPQEMLENEFKKELLENHGIHFNNLYSITNMPISRFLDYLIKKGNYVSYMETLVNAFNVQAAKSVMCLDMISISWDGYMYDCDFNQMLDMKIKTGTKTHISEFDHEKILNREVAISQHCYGCTAGSGSSCGGATV